MKNFKVSEKIFRSTGNFLGRKVKIVKANGMKKLGLKKKNTSKHTLVGCWISGTESGSEIEYVVNSHGSGFKVKAKDKFDGEVADIFDVKWDGRILSFGTLWNSTGRFLRCKFQAVAKNEVSYTYTYTANETWHRKSA